MRAGVLIGVILVIVAAIALLWIGRETGTSDPASVADVQPPGPATVPPPRTVAAPPERVRVQPPVAAEPDDAATPPVEAVEPTDTAEPAAAGPTVPDLLAKAIADFRIEDVFSLREAFGYLSGVTGAPIHVDLESVKALDDNDGVVLQMAGVAGKDILGMMAMVSGFEVTVLDDKVVLHPKDLEWTEGRRTVLIEPVVPDPDAPTSITVTGRVVGPDGNAVPGATLMLGGLVAGVADASGSFEVEVRPKRQLLTAVAPLRQRSAPFHVEGEYGTTLATVLVLGPPAGGVRVRFSHADGELPHDLRASVAWPDPEASGFIVTDGGRQRGWTEALNSDDDGVAAFDRVAPGPAFVRVIARGHRTESRTLDVEAGAWAEIAIEVVRESLEQRLRDERISFTFTDARVDAVVNYIRTTKNVNIALLPGAREGSSAERVTLTASDDTVESALHALCSAIGDVTWRIENDVVLIDKRER